MYLGVVRFSCVVLNVVMCSVVELDLVTFITVYLILVVVSWV